VDFHSAVTPNVLPARSPLTPGRHLILRSSLTPLSGPRSAAPFPPLWRPVRAFVRVINTLLLLPGVWPSRQETFSAELVVV